MKKIKKKSFTAREQNRFVKTFGFKQRNKHQTDLLRDSLRVQIRESFSGRNSLLILHSTGKRSKFSNASQTSETNKNDVVTLKIKHSQSGHAVEKSGKRSSTSFSQGNESAPSDFRPTSKAKVPTSHLPVNAGSDSTKTKDFLKVKSARSVRRIAKARNSSMKMAAQELQLLEERPFLISPQNQDQLRLTLHWWWKFQC